MGVLRFDGVDDRIRFTTVATALSNVGAGAWTCAALFRRATLGQWDGVSYLLDTAGTEEEAGYSVDNLNIIRCDSLRGGTCDFNSGNVISTTDAYLCVVSKATGTVAPRRGLMNLGQSQSMIHFAGSAAIANGNAAVQLALGAFEGTDPFDGWLGLVAWWAGDMTDAQKELLWTNRRTSDWWNHPFGQPVFLCELNNATPTDLAGNASGVSYVGGIGTVDNTETLAGWRFDGKGNAYSSGQVAVSYGDFPKSKLRRTV